MRSALEGKPNSAKEKAAHTAKRDAWTRDEPPDTSSLRIDSQKPDLVSRGGEPRGWLVIEEDICYSFIAFQTRKICIDAISKAA
jgi:hypothetical protein